MKNRSKSKYTIGSLLVLLAFLFYMTRNHSLEWIIKSLDRNTEKPQNKKEDGGTLRQLTAFQGKITGIKDGDTFEIVYDGQPERVRLADIDCPEKSQAFGKNAKQYASDLCFGKTVTVIPQKKRDKYGRILGMVITSDSLNVNEELVRSGLAWNYKYSKNKVFSALEKEAREQKIGLWADENPVNPWQWRKDRRSNTKNMR